MIAWLAILYLPFVGRGFLKDDFRWIAESRIGGVEDLWRMATSHVGFYRPIVALTFGINDWMFGLQAYGYAFTNFLLLALSVLAIRRLGLAVGLRGAGATAACAVWALNFHGIGGSLLWISGRTSLLLTLFAVLAITAWVRQRPIHAAAWLAAALFSKEDAVAVPFIMALWSATRGTFVRDAWRLAAVNGPVLALYGAARWSSGAFSYWDAPTYYRPSLEGALIVKNILQYVDRNATFAVACLVALCLAARRRPTLSASRLRLVLFGLGWTVLAQLPTLALPARSSLYVVLPSVGLALACAAAAEAIWEGRGEVFRRRVLAGALVAAVALWPVYYLRNQRLAELASLSASVVTVLEQLGPRAHGHVIVLRDDPAARSTFADAFGALFPDVQRLFVPQAAGLRLEPSLSGTPPQPLPDTQLPEIAIALEDGQVVAANP